MSELRAPDPTLTALDTDATIVMQRGTTPLQTAHLASGMEVGGWRTGCGLLSLDIARADEVRWFAVPCRTCFPDAPPPGMRAARHCPCEWHSGGPQLAWQTGGAA